MSANAPTASAARTWRIPRPPLEGWLFITFCGWGTMLLGEVAIGSLIDHWAWLASLFGQEVGDISVTYSIWAVMAGIAIWFVGFLGGYYVHNYLPAFVANGLTRRDASIGAAVFAGILSVTAAVLITVGYIWERVVYAIAGWDRGTPDETMLIANFNDYPGILGSNLLAMVMWVVGGAMIGSAFYRGNFRGAIAVAIALLLISVVGGDNGIGTPATIFSRQLQIAPSFLLTTVTTIGCTLAMVAITWWWNLQRLPLRNK